MLQGVWAAALVLPRTYDTASGTYGNLYGNLLDYVISAALIFYILTIAGVFRLRHTRPDAERPYRAFGYPVVPALYIIGASVILVVLFAYRPATTWPGLLIVLLGLPVYYAWHGRNRRWALGARRWARRAMHNAEPSRARTTHNHREFGDGVAPVHERE